MVSTTVAAPPKEEAKATKIPERSPFRPIYNCVLIEPETKILKQDRDGDIIKIPDQLKKKPMTGIVVAVGGGRPLNEKTDIPLKTKVGDRVVFDRYAALPFLFNKKEMYITQETQIFMIIEDMEMAVTSITT